MIFPYSEDIFDIFFLKHPYGEIYQQGNLMELRSVFIGLSFSPPLLETV